MITFGFQHVTTKRLSNPLTGKRNENYFIVNGGTGGCQCWRIWIMATKTPGASTDKVGFMTTKTSDVARFSVYRVPHMCSSSPNCQIAIAMSIIVQFAGCHVIYPCVSIITYSCTACCNNDEEEFRDWYPVHHAHHNLTLSVLNYFLGSIKYTCIVYHFSNVRWQTIPILSCER